MDAKKCHHHGCKRRPVGGSRYCFCHLSDAKHELTRAGYLQTQVKKGCER